ncbi:glycosyl hydrolase [Georgenia sp. TF02-10]|uniref:glycoside hydrolase 5 family protein n=1 Tax=Georgenia sp. TF02-10 TaxID=2917725 RepID=UPI001FA70057|nr:glycosyl hydrolase [Georgenia sp. TF02-10]UNX54915.1 glycosyl hydrolase [Georgenia sp. TF02-10]
MTPLRFGVNYTPSHRWFYSWHDVDWRSTERDLAAVAGLGMDHVRVFPLWPVLQPNRTYIDPAALADLRRTVDIAAAQGLEVYLDVLQGHLSSFDFVPSWLSSWHRGNMFTDAAVLQAQADLVTAVHDALADQPAYRGLTLGNELNQFAGTPHPSPMPATSRDVDTWLDTLLGAAPADPGRLRLHAEYDAVWYLDGHPFLPRHAARQGDLTAVHSWVFNGTAQRYGADSPHSHRHAEYLVELARAFATDPERGVWLQEIGAPGNVLDPEQVVPFARASVRHAAESPALWGVTWWCSHDVDPTLGDFPPFEHTLGLIDQGGQVKPLGHAFAEAAAELRDQAAAPGRTTAVVVPVDQDDTPVSRAALGPGGSVFEEWVRLAEDGQRPALVTSTTATDPDDLRRRGITRLHRVEPRAGAAYTSVSDEELAPVAEAGSR